MLLSAGADLEKAANDGSTPLSVACYQVAPNPNPNTVRTLTLTLTPCEP